MRTTGLFTAIAVAAAMLVPAVSADAAPKGHEYNNRASAHKAPTRNVRRTAPVQRHKVVPARNMQSRNVKSVRTRQVRNQQIKNAQQTRKIANQAYRQGVKDAQRVARYYDNRRVPAPYYNNGYPVVYSKNTAYRNAAYNDRYWWGQNGQVYCRRNDGTTGTIVGAVAGGVLGNMIAGAGDKTVGAVVGGALGAFLGREIERGDAHCR